MFPVSYEHLSGLETWLAWVSIHTPVSLVSLYLVTWPFCTWEHFVDWSTFVLRESFLQGQISESSVRATAPGNTEIPEEEVASPLECLSPEQFINNKKTCRQSVCLGRPLTAAWSGCSLHLGADVTHTSLLPSLPHPTCKLEMEERGVSKTWNLSCLVGDLYSWVISPNNTLESLKMQKLPVESRQMRAESIHYFPPDSHSPPAAGSVPAQDWCTVGKHVIQTLGCHRELFCPWCEG